MRLFPRLALLALLPLLAAACSGSSSTQQTAGVIHRLLQAAGLGGAGELESFTGTLPPGLPAEPPRYQGAKLVMSSRQPAPLAGEPVATPAGDSVPRPTLYFIVYDTGDDRDRVFDFYEGALDTDPWRLENTYSTTGLDTLEFSNADDADIAGAVAIAEGGNDGRTSILVTMQDAGAFIDEQPPFHLGDSLAVPKEFPAGFPSYQRSTVISTAFFREPGSESFLIEFLTTDSADQVVQFYRDQLHSRDWTLLEGAPLGVQQRIDFHDPENTVQGTLQIDSFARDQTYTDVKLQLEVHTSVTPAPTPSAAPATATP